MLFFVLSKRYTCYKRFTYRKRLANVDLVGYAMPEVYLVNRLITLRRQVLGTFILFSTKSSYGEPINW